MKLIGIEEHLLTREVRDAWNAIGLAARDPGAALHSGEIERRLLDWQRSGWRLWTRLASTFRSCH